jgi:hypothetical protein
MEGPFSKTPYFLCRRRAQSLLSGVARDVHTGPRAGGSGVFSPADGFKERSAIGSVLEVDHSASSVRQIHNIDAPGFGEAIVPVIH